MGLTGLSDKKKFRNSRIGRDDFIYSCWSSFSDIPGQVALTLDQGLSATTEL